MNKPFLPNHGHLTSAFGFPNHDAYTVIDFETTGLSPYQHEIIEFCGLRIRNGKIVDRYQVLVKPRGVITSFITNLTGISPEMVEDAPYIEEVLPLIVAFLGSDLIIGHNISFDWGFLCANLQRYGLNILSNRRCDTVALARHTYPFFPNHQLHTVCKRVNTEFFPSHRAESDCLATFELYEKMKIAKK